MEFISNDSFKNKSKNKIKLIYVSDNINKIIKNEFNELYDHSWIEYIYLYNVFDQDYKYVFFKNIFISKIEIKELNDEVFLKKLLFAIINKIKNEKIILSIYYLPDIININYEINKLFAIQESNKELNTLFLKKENRYRKYCINNTYDIEFIIENNNISFYVKKFKFFECLLVDIENNIKNNKIFDLYNKIKKTKTKILLYLGEIHYYDNDFILDLFKLGYWVDLKLNYEESQKEIVDILFFSNIFIFYYYDIIIFDSNTFNTIISYLKTVPLNDYLYDQFKKKKIIVLNLCLSSDMLLHRGLRLHFFSEEFLKKYKFNEFIDYVIPSMLEYTLNNLNELWFTKELKNIEYKIKNRLSYNIINGPQLLISKNNDFLLSKNHFMELYGLDKSKKIFTVFVSFPSYFNDNELYKNNYFLLNNLKKILNNNNYNLLIKCHPCNSISFVKDKVFINKDCNAEKIRQFNDNRENIEYLNNNFVLVHGTCQNEVYEYTDNGLIMNMASSCIYFNYLFKIPFLYIVNNDEMQKKIFSYWKINKFGENINYDKFMKNFDETIINFLNKTKVYKESFKYFDNNPIYGNTYNNMYQEFKTIIDDRIKQFNFKTNNESLVLLSEYLTKYGEPFIKVKINMYEITLLIEKDNTPSSYGVSIPIYQKEFNEIINISFLCKLEEIEEEDVFVKIYTGIKWITMDEPLTKDYKLFNINEKFNLYSSSRWRISSTTKKIGQKIFIKIIQ